MKILIVEDETAAYENLLDMLLAIDPTIEMVGNTESIAQTVRWLENNERPDLIFMDIHLSDGSAFAIFDQMKVESPIIFTTAYDQYAIEAFKVNSIDYLLKPIKPEDLQRALDKFSRWTHQEVLDYLSQLTQLSPSQKYLDRTLLSVNDRLLPIRMREVACFYVEDRRTIICMMDGTKYPYPKTMDQTIAVLNPADFIRANKQYIISRQSIKELRVWFDNRLLVHLTVDTPERIIISKNKVSEFKSWLLS